MTGSFDPGFLAHRIAVERPVETPDGSGGATLDWQPLATLWAAIEPLGAAESTDADRLATRITHRVTIRFRADVEGGMRLIHRGRSLRIAALRDPDETRRFLELHAEEERT